MSLSSRLASDLGGFPSFFSTVPFRIPLLLPVVTLLFLFLAPSVLAVVAATAPWIPPPPPPQLLFRRYSSDPVRYTICLCFFTEFCQTFMDLLIAVVLVRWIRMSLSFLLDSSHGFVYRCCVFTETDAAFIAHCLPSFFRAVIPFCFSLLLPFFVIHLGTRFGFGF